MSPWHSRDTELDITSCRRGGKIAARPCLFLCLSLSTPRTSESTLSSPLYCLNKPRHNQLITTANPVAMFQRRLSVTCIRRSKEAGILCTKHSAYRPMLLCSRSSVILAQPMRLCYSRSSTGLCWNLKLVPYVLGNREPQFMNR